MSFKFKIEAVADVFRDPHRHYRHSTVIVGRIIEGTLHRGDLVSVPARDGSRLGSRACAFDFFHEVANKSEISAEYNPDPLSILLCKPAPSKAEIALEIVTECSPQTFHELMLGSLRHNPHHLLHNRGPEALEYGCGECTSVLYKYGRVLHPDFESVLQHLLDSSDSYIASRARSILNNAMTEETHAEWVEGTKIQKPHHPAWMFWKRK